MLGGGLRCAPPENPRNKNQKRKTERQPLFFIDSTGTLLARDSVPFYSAIDIQSGMELSSLPISSQTEILATMDLLVPDDNNADFSPIFALIKMEAGTSFVWNDDRSHGALFSPETKKLIQKVFDEANTLFLPAGACVRVNESDRLYTIRCAHSGEAQIE